MKKVYLLAVVAAVLFGALMYLYLQGPSATQSQQVETKTVVVATVDIAPDVTITDEMVAEKEVPASSVQVNAITKKSDVVGKCCPAQIVKGEQLVSNMLSDPNEAGTRLAAQLENGMYGMTIEVETDAGVGGYVKAGDHIDLMGSVQVVDESGNITAYLPYEVVEGVEVVRVNEASEEGQTPYSYLTLTMTKAQCELVYAYQSGNVSGSTSSLYAILNSSKGGAQ